MVAVITFVTRLCGAPISYEMILDQTRDYKTKRRNAALRRITTSSSVRQREKALFLYCYDRTQSDDRDARDGRFCRCANAAADQRSPTAVKLRPPRRQL